MKKKLLCLTLAACLTLSGCSAMLNRSYSSTTPHVDQPATADDPSVLRVENYQELVSAVLYLVSQVREEGVIELYDYTDDVEKDLSAACLEVAKEDPLGAYAVDYIKHAYSRVVSYYRATITVSYRRTPEQIHSIANVTGSSAIRTELQQALSDFAPEAVLRVAYFDQNEDSIAALIRQAYYDTPLAAFGMPESAITIYPDSGSQRVVEIVLTYPDDPETLRKKSAALLEQAQTLAIPLRGNDASTTAYQVIQAVRARAVYNEEGGSTAYDALVDGSADALGMALAYELICQQTGLNCEIVIGTRAGRDFYWNAVTSGAGDALYVDTVYGDGFPHAAQEMVQAGYDWTGAPARADDQQNE